MDFEDEEVVLELDGPGIHPESVDTLVLLRLATAYFRLLSKVSEVKKVGLALTGLRVVDKCAAVVSRSSSATAARLLVDYSVQIVSGVNLPPFGTEMAANDVREQLRGLNTEFSVKVRAGKWEVPLRVVDEQLRSYAWESTELRATVIKVGGDRPRVQLQSDSEAERFWLDISGAQAEALGRLLYREVDFDVTIVRDPTGKIEEGKVTELHFLDDAAPADAWRAWFAKAGAHWNEVDDVLTELGRGD